MADGLNEGIAQGIPWSGGERNHVYFGGFPGTQFEDLSGITGIDDPGDGRSFSVLDFDRDGRPDLALASPGSPRLRLLRNGIGERVGIDHGFVAIRLVGGNHRAAPDPEWSARDGFGTALALTLSGGHRIYREHQPETGYVGQNSSTLIVGIGDRDSIAKLEVRWLSGKIQSIGDLPARALVTVYENPAQSPTGEAFVIEEYVKPAEKLLEAVQSPGFWKTRLLPKTPRSSELVVKRDGQPIGAKRGLTLLGTMATWCVACVDEMPEFRALRAAFSPDELAIFGVPVDKEDSESMLEAWESKHRPPYEILKGIEMAEVDKVNAVTATELHSTAVPATFLTDASGRVLVARWGVPSISDVERYLWEYDSQRGELIASAEGGPTE
ncbi:MAG: ASPIC/UnbV domain-containing protein [Vicinamibacteria bacterium]